ncbi:diaminohydroxyphosphoribosylaminopyrimidine deaminase [Cohaesibacter sp. ES.047]|uniref:bifunctional diaminohydroxyphosphoribosylaminopyrimidine deaminase/5-amino-6-(5-phosphoribosylamino)uracil reductase RibD n=1 Tax=Cohaesibacter sp. ES.047 TaxID=1798205 RepID=UPI000BC09062|nr:bifunctional diaminohydroxyphosphoribosylaminopyrimidine deaminase/5-amino-6-(5-phosphoribosylamino)uracil reductase RibD [Cohaesibacter sp. ES.047]SNY93088.1 diaminohydroxyphosphoribosylaminopyrimidine deaminase [Cohaesibacter sp. ES.047]
MQQVSQALTDHQLMDLALRLGARFAGATGDNPAVGCVIARHHPNHTDILGIGWTQQGGRPHAERVALAEAGAAARGAIAYVTLEPCSHHGRSSPCAEALIEAGIARVVCAHPDPDPRVSGLGFAMLREAGILVETGLLEPVAHRNLAGFLSRITRGTPWLEAKMALSPDGMIGKQGVGNYPITGVEAKRHTHAMRARADAILVGVETVLVDNPSLTVRLPGLEHRSPLRVILDSKGRTPETSALVHGARDVPVMILTTGAISTEKALLLEDHGCTVHLVEADKEGRVDLDAALRLLGDRGINRLFAETGAKLAEALLTGAFVDEFHLYRGSKTVGEHGLKGLGDDPDAMLQAAGLSLERTKHAGTDRLQTYVRAASLSALYQRK